jgi:hypothetical protein
LIGCVSDSEIMRRLGDVMWNDGLWEGRRAPEFSKLINPGERGMIEMRGEAIQNCFSLSKVVSKIRNPFLGIPGFLGNQMSHDDAK